MFTKGSQGYQRLTLSFAGRHSGWAEMPSFGTSTTFSVWYDEWIRYCRRGECPGQICHVHPAVNCKARPLCGKTCSENARVIVWSGFKSTISTKNSKCKGCSISCVEARIRQMMSRTLRERQNIFVSLKNLPSFIGKEGIICFKNVAKRRTPFQSEPVVGHRKISLLKLYQRVVELGGYDWVTEEKGACVRMC